MKRARIVGGVLLTGLLFWLPVENAQGQAKKKPGAPPSGTMADSDKLAPGEFVGVIKSTPGSDREFVIELESSRLVPAGGGGGGRRPGGAGNQQNGALRAQMQLQQAQAQMNNARTPQQRQQAMNRVRQATLQLQRALAQANRAGGGGVPAGYKVEKTKVPVEFQLAEKARIRTMVLPETFDEKGNIKTYSAKELADLKGKDKSAPGYEFSVEQLQVGQTVKVTLVRVPKEPDPLAKEKDDEDDDKSKQVKLVVVLKAADPNLLPKGAPKKKK